MAGPAPARQLTSVVVPAHNASATLPRQLEALAVQETSAPFEVLVVDNASTDDTAGVATAYADRVPGLRVVSARAAQGVAYARNAGVLAAAGDLVLFCDADDRVRPGWVEGLVRALDSADIAGGGVEVARVNDARTVAGVHTPPTDRLPTAMGYLPYAVGANLGIRRSLWEALDGFDQSYVGGHEEVDFAWRAQESGHVLGFAPDAVVDYTLRPSLRQSMRQRFGYGRSYAQLYSRFAHSPIRRTSLRHEVRVALILLGRAPRALARTDSRSEWLTTVAWLLGRWRGWLAFGTRPPL